MWEKHVVKRYGQFTAGSPVLPPEPLAGQTGPLVLLAHPSSPHSSIWPWQVSMETKPWEEREDGGGRERGLNEC